MLAEQDAAALEQLKIKKEQLQNGEPIRAKLDRQAKAFRPSQHATCFELPPDFYNLTAEELKREQQHKYKRESVYQIQILILVNEEGFSNCCFNRRF